MENGGGGGGHNHHPSINITRDAVISKLKDDGDFDRLRLQIIRNLKQKKGLRESIASMVRQSAALNRPGFENMKPRQLADAIHQEVGGKVMDQVSDDLWEIIKSGDGMKGEIKETVQSVYNKLVKPKEYENGESSHRNAVPVRNGPDKSGSTMTSAGEIDDTMTNGEPNEPPGFSQNDVRLKDNHEEQRKEVVDLPIPHALTKEEENREIHLMDGAVEPDALDPGSPPGFSVSVEHKQPCDGSDEDPDVPPGFG